MKQEEICKMMDFSILINFNISQDSNHDVDDDVVSIDSQINSMDDDNDVEDDDQISVIVDMISYPNFFWVLIVMIN